MKVVMSVLILISCCTNYGSEITRIIGLRRTSAGHQMTTSLYAEENRKLELENAALKNQLLRRKASESQLKFDLEQSRTELSQEQERMSKSQTTYEILFTKFKPYAQQKFAEQETDIKKLTKENEELGAKHISALACLLKLKDSATEEQRTIICNALQQMGMAPPTNTEQNSKSKQK